MNVDNTLPWRPSCDRAVQARESRVLWTVQKQRWQIDCILQGCEGQGWGVNVLLNGDWFFSCRFASRAEAANAAGDKHAELLTSGWRPSICS
jgi:hypothetical protein